MKGIYALLFIVFEVILITLHYNFIFHGPEYTVFWYASVGMRYLIMYLFRRLDRIGFGGKKIKPKSMQYISRYCDVKNSHGLHTTMRDMVHENGSSQKRTRVYYIHDIGKVYQFCIHTFSVSLSDTIQYFRFISEMYKECIK